MRALLARVHAHRLAVFQKEERGQRAPRLHAPGRHQLRRLENVQRRKFAVVALAFVDVRQRGIGGAQVDANLHAFTFSRTPPRSEPISSLLHAVEARNRNSGAAVSQPRPGNVEQKAVITAKSQPDLQMNRSKYLGYQREPRVGRAALGQGA